MSTPLNPRIRMNAMTYDKVINIFDSFSFLHEPSLPEYAENDNVLNSEQ